MNFTLKNKSAGLLTFYVVLAIPLAILLFFSLSYLGLNLFVGLDASAFGQLPPGPWLGYGLLGLGLGAAAGAVAAQRRFRLSKHLQTGAGALVVGLVAAAVVGNPAHFAPRADEAPEAGLYVRGAGQGQCPACTTVEASSTKADPGQNRYLASQLLDKNPATAWISAAPADQTLRLTLTLPAGQRLVGLRLTNGYAKNAQVYASFSRVRTCGVSLDGGPPARWTLPDRRAPDLFIPLDVAAGAAPAVLVFAIDDTYPGDNHPEVALSGLTPVIEATP